MPRAVKRAAAAQQLNRMSPHEPPPATPTALVQTPATLGFVVGAMVGIPGWHARGQGFKSPQLHPTTPQVTASAFAQRRRLPLPDCRIRATRVPLPAEDGSSDSAEAAWIGSSSAAAIAASRPAITCW
jgi:hypothetical protein